MEICVAVIIKTLIFSKNWIVFAKLCLISQFSGSYPLQQCVHWEDRAAQKALPSAEPKGKRESRQMERTGSNLLRILPNYLNFNEAVNRAYKDKNSCGIILDIL